MRFPRAFALLVIVAAASPMLVTEASAQGQAAAPAGDAPDAPEMTITGDTTWSGGTHAVPGDLVVRAPATLRILGGDLRIGHRILVERGAAMEIHPLAGTAATLGPLDPAPAAEVHGFWMQVNGTLRTGGTPATDIHGLRGTGLNNLYFAGGGIQVAGNATLTEVHLHDSNGTIVAAIGGRVELDHAMVERMGFMAAGALGPLGLYNSTIRDSVFGIIGKTLCDFTVRGSRIEATGQPVLVNGCPLDMSNTTLVGGKANGLYLAGAATGRIVDVDISGHGASGVAMRGLPSERDGKTIEVPNIRLQRVHVHAPGRAASDQAGIRLEAAKADLVDVSVEGSAIGILAKDGSTLGVRQSSLTNNGVGIAIVDSGMANDVAVSNTFGDRAAGTADKIAIQARITVDAVVRDGAGHLLPDLHLDVYSPWNGTNPIAHVDTGANTTASFVLTPYRTIAGGAPLFMGPYTYRLVHAALPAPATGTVDLARRIIIGQADAGPGNLAGNYLPDASGSPAVPAHGTGALTWPLVATALALAASRRRRR